MLENYLDSGLHVIGHMDETITTDIFDFPAGPMRSFTLRYPRRNEHRVMSEPAQDRMAYGVRQAAAALNLSERTIWSLVKSGELRSVMRAGRRLILKTELEGFLGRNQNARGIPEKR